MLLLHGGLARRCLQLVQVHFAGRSVISRVFDQSMLSTRHFHCQQQMHIRSRMKAHCFRKSQFLALGPDIRLRKTKRRNERCMTRISMLSGKLCLIKMLQLVSSANVWQFAANVLSLQIQLRFGTKFVGRLSNISSRVQRQRDAARKAASRSPAPA